MIPKLFIAAGVLACAYIYLGPNQGEPTGIYAVTLCMSEIQEKHPLAAPQTVQAHCEDKVKNR